MSVNGIAFLVDSADYKHFTSASCCLWCDCFPKVDGIVFLVDSADYEHFAKSKAKLNALLSIEELAKALFLVLGNKIDALSAVSKELRHHLGFYQLTSKVSFILCIFRFLC
ncbi:ADP-ribosylation factor family-domain-containing protein [Lanmaoa asiatica]|nr:ADP-ribosylation factor family-domain-containing protein [Lanmaoa asiatica]